MSEKDPNPEEIREAEALARALEGDGSSPDLPEEALQTAALLRSQELSEERSQAVLERILAGSLPGDSEKRRTRLRWLIPAGGLAAAVVAGWLLVVPGTLGDAGPTSLPDPGKALLQTLSEAARHSGPGLAELDLQMQKYRTTMYRALSQRYAE